MQPEVSGDTPDPAGTGGWVAWPLLVLAMLPVLGATIVARRVLAGRTTLYGDAPVDYPFRERVLLLLQAIPWEWQLLAPLLGLAALAWLARPGSGRRPPRAALFCGAGLAAAVALLAAVVCALFGYALLDGPRGDLGFFGSRESLLELFGPRLAGVLLLAALAAGLAVVLGTTARRSAPADIQQPDPAAHGELPRPDAPDLSAGAGADPPVDGDPHARFRRPS